MQFQWLTDGVPTHTRAQIEAFLSKLDVNSRQLRDMEQEAMVCGVSEGLSCGTHVFKVRLANAVNDDDNPLYQSERFEIQEHAKGYYVFDKQANSLDGPYAFRGTALRIIRRSERILAEAKP